jgi:predicted transglutaminase-like cysteine proteinase
MLRLRQTLLFLLSVIFISALPAADLSRVDDAEIQRLMDSVAGSNDAWRRDIQRRLTGWKAMLETPANRELPEPARLKLVNDFGAETMFVCDPLQWCLEDYWAKPLEFLANGGGDCEDYAITKYFALRALGVPDSKLHIMYAQYNNNGVNGAHMVLAYYPTPGDEPLILDNLDYEIRPAAQRKDLTPRFGFNAQDLWEAQELKGRNANHPYSSWRKEWSRVQADTTIRVVTAEQRKGATCQALASRQVWCRR